MEILFYAVLLLVGAVFMVFSFTMVFPFIEGKKHQREVVDEVPYKIEPRDLETTDFSTHVVAVSEQFDKEFPATKRKYTKRSTYWTARRKKKVVKKAKAKRKSK